MLATSFGTTTKGVAGAVYTAPVRRSVPLILFFALLLLDQLVKFWAMANLEEGSLREFLPGLLSLTLTYNTGAAWSLLSGAALPLALGRLAVGVGLLVYLLRRAQPPVLTVSLSLIAAGAVGNAIDGLRQGRVTDMFYSPLLSSVTRALRQGEFPIFNVADSCVVVGVLLLLIASFWPSSKPVSARANGK